MSSLQGMIASWGASYSFTRKVSGTYTDGIYTAGSSSPLSMIASIQPITGRDLQSLAEGEHANDYRLVFTETELKTRSPGFEADIITVDGEAWEVVNVEKWFPFGTHYRCRIARRPVP